MAAVWDMEGVMAGFGLSPGAHVLPMSVQIRDHFLLGK